MKRVRHMAAFAAVWIIIAMYGCASTNMTEPAAPFHRVIATGKNTDNEISTTVTREVEENSPVRVVRGISPYNGGYILYPEIQNTDTAQSINESMCSAVAAKAQNLHAPIFTDYRVEHNHDGIFSVRIYLYDLYGSEGRCLESVSLNYDVNSGELCRISDIFDDSNDRWRGLIPDIVTAQAQDRDITLLNDLMPIDDGQEFYVTDDSVVLVYDVYEIATYSAGAPEFCIPIGQVGEFIDDNGPLGRVKAENIAETEMAEAAMEAN